MPLLQRVISYILLESTCNLFVIYHHEFINSESYDVFALPVEREL